MPQGASRDILLKIIEEYGNRLSCDDQKGFIQKFLEFLQDVENKPILPSRLRLSPNDKLIGTKKNQKSAQKKKLKNWVENNMKPDPSGAQQLAAFFNYFLDEIVWLEDWFRLDFESFNRCLALAQKEAIVLSRIDIGACYASGRQGEDPKIQINDIDNLKNRFDGIYVIYRVSQEQIHEIRYCRELIGIYRTGNEIHFKNYNVLKKEEEKKPHSFNGSALPTGETIVFFGSAWKASQRGRVFFFNDQVIASDEEIKVHIGLMTSSGHNIGEPFSSRVLFMKYDSDQINNDTSKKERKDILSKLAKEIVLTPPRADIINHDFGSDLALTINDILSNKLKNGILIPDTTNNLKAINEYDLSKNWTPIQNSALPKFISKKLKAE